MRSRFSFSITMPAIALVVGAASAVSITGLSAQAPALKTAWGEPDLQGIWTDESDTPLQRSPKFANQETFTSSMSPAPTTPCSPRRSALARAPR